MEKWDAVPFLGLSATPWTKGLGKHYDDLIIGSSTQDMIDEGHLASFEVFAPASPDLSGVKTVAGDYHEGQLSEVMSKSKLVADVVETWKKLGNDDPTLCYGVDRAHANMLMEQFNAAGVPAGYMDAFTPIEERKDIERRFHEGDLKVVCNVGVLTTGIDWDVRTLILVRPTKSRILFTQIVGRALRTAAGKEVARILDHSSTHENLGMVTDINISELDDGKANKSSTSKEPEIKLPKKCPSCHFLKPVGIHACPQCGFAPSKRSQITNESGQLVKLDGKQIPLPRLRNKVDTNDMKDRMWTDFRRIAKSRGYSDGWVSHTYKKYYGVWPRNRHVEPTGATSDEAREFVEAQLLAYKRDKR
jgi:superfamily II DNA or RNA helicase